jgi:hypothetical protein
MGQLEPRFVPGERRRTQNAPPYDRTALLFPPFTDKFPEATTVASVCTATTLTAALFWRPLRKRSATVALAGAIWLAGLCPDPTDIPVALRFGPNSNLLFLQASATLATLAALLEGTRVLGLFAVLGQLCLWGLGLYLRESSYDLVALHLAECGVLFGLAGLLSRAGARGTGPPRSLSLVGQDAGIFVVSVLVVACVSHLTFGGFAFNGDEVANSFQADVYGHLRAYAPVPPCPSMFENYWVFRYEGRVFSQYTPGWPLFMAPFQRLGVIWLAGPTMAGIVAVGVARLSRRVASGLGGTAHDAMRIVRLAGPLGAASALLGPSLLLNGASRFSHTMVCACFAWSVESLCVVSAPELSRRRAWGYGLLLGAATSLGLATRPADGGTLGLGVFTYFLWAFARRRIGWRALAGTALGFLFFGGLTALVLRLQLGSWFRTAYSISETIHPEAALKLSPPAPNQLRLPVPLAFGSYCFWPASFALGSAGLVQALGGRERRVVFMLVTSACALMGFYAFVEFGRYSYDGLGPRYVLPIVVMLAPGTAALLSPPIRRLAVALKSSVRLPVRLLSALPAVFATAAIAIGVYRIVPLVVPLASVENVHATAPLRAAKKLGLKNAIVILEPGKLPADWWNLAQNAPLDPAPDVLFLARRTEADEACARRHFPGRTWYRAQQTEALTRY